jgi:hypothetical protein
MIALTLYDGKDTQIMVRGTHREAALQCEKIIREYRLVDGHVGMKGEGSCFNDLHAMPSRYIDDRFSKLVGVPRAFGMGHGCTTMIENTSAST